MLGLTLAHRVAALGHQVTILEAAKELGGLAAGHDYGEFVWDRFYHCILPQDEALIELLTEFGLGDQLRWQRTGTGYFSEGRSYSMSGNADFLRFPLLSLLQKARLGASILYATRCADPYALYRVTAEAWLTKICGAAAYRVFWRPLLQAKFGPYHDRVAAVFIWATLKRLFGARRGSSNQEKLGYVRGGYARILESMARALESAGVRLLLGRPVERIDTTNGAGGQPGCRVQLGAEKFEFDLVLFTAPTGVARRVVDDALQPHVERIATEHPTSAHYLGVLCLVLALPRPLTPYYVLNIGDNSIGLTGLIEMTNLIDAESETAGRSLIYLPRYLDSEDPLMEADSAELRSSFFDPGMKRLFPELDLNEASYAAVHRARFVQPLPLARDDSVEATPAPIIEPPFQLLNTSMLQCATLNNNEVVALVNSFVERNRRSLDRS